MNTPSLARRITIALVAITGAVVLLAALGIWFDTRHLLLVGVDREMDRIVENLRKRDRDPLPEMRIPRLGQVPGNERRRLIQVLDAATGQELFRSPLMAPGDSLVPAEDRPGAGDPPTRNQDPPAPFPIDDGHAPSPDDPPRLANDRPHSALIAGSHWYRVRILHLQNPPPSVILTGLPGPVIVYIGIDMTPITDELWRMALVLAAYWFTATGLAWIAVTVLLKTILRPIHQLTEAIATLGPNDLAARVPDDASPREVRTILIRVNDLMDRLEQAFRREQATISNIAHELRTPVTVLRTSIEFRLLAPDCTPAETRVLTTCLETIRRMQAQVANLLLLARLEAGKEPLEREDVDVVLLIDEALDPWRGRSSERGQSITVTSPGSVIVSTAPGHLMHILGNLLGNAVLHAPTGVAIGVILHADDQGLTLEVANPCAEPLIEDQLGKAFYRGDSARRSSEHNGLGLVLCHRLAQVLGGTLKLTSRDGRFTAVLHLPR